MAKLLVSLATYNEIYGLLEKEGKQINSGEPLTIEKGTALVPPVDFRLMTIRRDVADIAAKSYIQGEDIVQHTNKLYQFVLNGTVQEQKDTPETKKKATPKSEQKEGW